MHLVPLALGVLAILIGIAMVAFGVPINEFGTGNTLIAAGTTAIVGGFILLGLWAAVLQLQRLLGALEPGSTGLRRGRTAGAPDLERAPFQAESAGRAPFREPRFAPEEAPDRDSGEGPEPEKAAEHQGWIPPEGEPEPRTRERPSGDERLATREEGSSWELFAPSRLPSPARERSFDAIWPSEERLGQGAREAAQVGGRGRTGAHNPEQGPAAGSPATILKSGVINGMAYTLYTDGSIEAELPQGTLRFGSLDELRDYLARNT